MRITVKKHQEILDYSIERLNQNIEKTLRYHVKINAYLQNYQNYNR